MSLIPQPIEIDEDMLDEAEDIYEEPECVARIRKMSIKNKEYFSIDSDWE